MEYREFHLDLNERNSGTSSYISLDALEIFAAETGDLTGYNNTTNTFASGASDLLYNLDANGNITVGLTDWSTGSGHGDYAVAIRNDAFAEVADDDFIYLYTAFGSADASSVDGEFEEWYVRDPAHLDNQVTVTTAEGATRVRLRASDSGHEYRSGYYGDRVRCRRQDR